MIELPGIRPILFAAGLLAIASASLAATPMQQRVETRQANFKQQGAALKAINDEFKKDTPDPAVLTSNAVRLKALTTQLPSWFPKGSGAESGAKTDAKPEIWSDPAGFIAAANRLQVEASKLQQLAVVGDIAGMKGQTRATGGACKGCHDKYRVPEKK